MENYISLVTSEREYSSDTIFTTSRQTWEFDPPIVTDSERVDTMSAVVVASIQERIYDRQLDPQ